MKTYDKITREALKEYGSLAVSLPIPDDASKELLTEIISWASFYHEMAIDDAEENYWRYELECPADLTARMTHCYERWNLAEKILKDRGFVQTASYREWTTKAESRRHKLAYLLAHPSKGLKGWWGYSNNWRYAGVHNGDVSVTASVYHSYGPLIQLEMRLKEFEDEPTEIYIWPDQAVSLAFGLLRLTIYASLYEAKLDIRKWYRAKREVMRSWL